MTMVRIILILFKYFWTPPGFSINNENFLIYHYFVFFRSTYVHTAIIVDHSDNATKVVIILLK